MCKTLPLVFQYEIKHYIFSSISQNYNSGLMVKLPFYILHFVKWNVYIKDIRSTMKLTIIHMMLLRKALVILGGNNNYSTAREGRKLIHSMGDFKKGL